VACGVDMVDGALLLGHFCCSRWFLGCVLIDSEDEIEGCSWGGI
jgi:hypothetical protein